MRDQDNSPNKRQGQDNEKIEQLKAYVQQSKYIDVLEQRGVCASFGLPYMVNVFRDEYRKRFYEYLKSNITTVATVSKVTGIPEKYLCQVKSYFESRKMLKVLFEDRCPTTGSKGVNFLSTNPADWDDPSLLPNSNQTSLF